MKKFTTSDFVIEPYHNIAYEGGDSEVTYHIISIEDNGDNTTTFVFNVKESDYTEVGGDLSKSLNELSIEGVISYNCKLSFIVDNKFLKVKNKTLTIDANGMNFEPFSKVNIDYKDFDITKLYELNDDGDEIDLSTKKYSRALKIVENYYRNYNMHEDEIFGAILPYEIEFKLK